MVIHAIPQQNIVYPESDGKPMGETDDHRILLGELIFALTHALRDQVVYVSGNNMLYYEEGNPAAVVSPDVYVVFGVPQDRKRTYKTWEHGGKGPDLVIELTSASTRYEDLGDKRVRYAELGVKEYYLFDPLGEYLKPQLRAYELVDGELIPVAGSRIISRALQMELRPEGRSLRLYDVATGAKLLIPDELEAARQREAEARQREVEARQREAEARQAAESEVQRLREELAQLRRGL